MSGNTFGTIFRITTWGESHGSAVGVVVDGCPAGLALAAEDIQKELDRRRPGQSRAATARQEADRVEILSGIFEDRTTGPPISLLVWNKDANSSAYDLLRDKPRPGHANYAYQMKYGLRDHRGGGRGPGLGARDGGPGRRRSRGQEAAAGRGCEGREEGKSAGT